VTTPDPTRSPGWRIFGRRAPQARAWWLARGRGERLILGVSAVIIVVAIPLTVGLAAAVLIPQPGSGPALLVQPSYGAAVPTAAPTSSFKAGTTPAATPSSSPHTADPVAWALPAGWRHDLVCDDENAHCSLHLYDGSGREQDGWPVAIPGRCDGDVVAVGPRNSVFVACTDAGRAIVSGLNQAGAALAGWPVRLRGAVALSDWNDFQFNPGSPSVRVSSDGTVYVSVTTSQGGGYAIQALAPDGSSRSGWPVVLAGGAQGFDVALDGTVVAWWYEHATMEIVLDASRTVFTMLDAKGRTLPGWPRGSAGAASGPVVWRDGSIYYVSAGGKVWGHDRTGEIIHGWPYALPMPIAPSLRDDGLLIFLADSGVFVLDRQGRDAPGWPYRTGGTLMAPGCDTPGWPHPMSAVGSHGVMYLAVWDGTSAANILALDPQGRSVDGWPYHVPVGWRVEGLDRAADGSLTAALTSEQCGGGTDATSIRLAPTGQLIGDLPGTPLPMIYSYLRLDGPRSRGGETTYTQGAQIDFEFGLVNGSSDAVMLPRVDYHDDTFYAAGVYQTWLERLGPTADIACLPRAGRLNIWYPTGGWLAMSAEPVTLPPRGEMPSSGSLASDLTACLPPGDYRYHVQWKRLDDDDVESLWETGFDFRIVSSSTQSPDADSSPGITPPPTPIPRPLPTPLPTPQATGTAPSPMQSSAP